MQLAAHNKPSKHRLLFLYFSFCELRASIRHSTSEQSRAVSPVFRLRLLTKMNKMLAVALYWTDRHDSSPITSSHSWPKKKSKWAYFPNILITVFLKLSKLWCFLMMFKFVYWQFYLMLETPHSWTDSYRPFQCSAPIHVLNRASSRFIVFLAFPQRVGGGQPLKQGKGGHMVVKRTVSLSP